MTTEELVAYYADLLIMQYAALPNASAQVSLFIDQLVANQILIQINDAFDPDTAVGPQMDILGLWVGAPRQLFGFDFTKNFFELPSVSTTPSGPHGFGLVADAATLSWFFLRVADATDVVTTLSDAEMSQLVMYLASLESLDLTDGDIDLFLQKFFGHYVTLTDNMDMTIVYTHDHTDPNTLFSVVAQLGVLPHPAGVGLTIVTV